MAHTENWSATYESEPADSDSPSGGDDEFRDLKLNIRERMLFEHQWKDSTTTDGHHKEGSARSYYTNTAPTTRPDGTTSLDSSDKGRMWWDINDTNALYHWDGSTWCDDVKVAGNLEVAGSVDFDGVVTFADAVTITSNVDITGSLDVAGAVDLDDNVNVAGTLTVSGVVDFDSNVQVAGTLSLASPLYIENDSGDGGGSFSSGAEFVRIVGDSESLKIHNYSGGDYAIANTEQNNAIVLYDGAGGVGIFYNGTEVVKINSNGVSIQDHDYRFSGRHFTDSYHSTSCTENDVFDALKNYIPNDGDSIGLYGGWALGGTLRTLSRAYRVNSTTIRLYYVDNSTVNTINAVDGDTDVMGDFSLAW